MAIDKELGKYTYNDKINIESDIYYKTNENDSDKYAFCTEE